jgi:hypothetical protein
MDERKSGRMTFHVRSPRGSRRKDVRRAQWPASAGAVFHNNAHGRRLSGLYIRVGEHLFGFSVLG